MIDTISTPFALALGEIRALYVDLLINFVVTAAPAIIGLVKYAFEQDGVVYSGT